MLLYLSKKINEVLYCYTYILVFIIFGYTINSFTCCLCTILIKLFTKDLPFLLESILTIFCPLILSIYGIKNAKNTIVEKVTVHYPKLKGNKKTICHLSDLHLCAIYQRNFVEKIVMKI